MSDRSTTLTGTPAPRGVGFFLSMAAVLMLVTLLGFARTFYLQPLTSEPPLSRALVLHGTAWTAWFSLLLLQTFLVRERRVHLHRTLGAAGGIVALAAVLASAWILAVRDAPYVETAPGRGFGNLMSLVAFALCVGAGLWYRRRLQVHRRLVLAGSIVVVAPALSRIFYQPAGASGPATVVATLLLLASLLVHDVFRNRRPHAASVAALALIFGVAPVITLILIETGAWTRVLEIAG